MLDGVNKLQEGYVGRLLMALFPFFSLLPSKMTAIPRRKYKRVCKCLVDVVLVSGVDFNPFEADVYLFHLIFFVYIFYGFFLS